MTPPIDKMDRFASLDASPEQAIIDREEAAAAPESPSLSSPAVRAAIEHLPRREREALMAFYHRTPQRAIAEQQGVTQPAVHGRIRKAVRRLRWILGGMRRLDETTRDLMARALHPGDTQVLVMWAATGANANEVARRLHLAPRDARRACKAALARLVVAAVEDPELAEVAAAFAVLHAQQLDLSRAAYATGGRGNQYGKRGKR